jgi:hypothetical protein
MYHHVSSCFRRLLVPETTKLNIGKWTIFHSYVSLLSWSLNKTLPTGEQQVDGGSLSVNSWGTWFAGGFAFASLLFLWWVFTL